MLTASYTVPHGLKSVHLRKTMRFWRLPGPRLRFLLATLVLSLALADRGKPTVFEEFQYLKEVVRFNIALREKNDCDEEALGSK